MFLKLILIVLVLDCVLKSDAAALTCDSKIYCSGDVLHYVEMSRLFPDSKTFVDMPTRYSEEQVITNFKLLKNLSDRGEMEKFVKDNFYPVGVDTVKAEPVDWTSAPKFLAKIKDENMKKFATDLNHRWKDLLRRFDPAQICPQCKTSAILTNNSFTVPGGRFIEYYYWDSYWIIEGLLVSEMNQTARGMIQNFLDIIGEIGFIPNGARIYYLNRSQPPLLTQMVELYLNRTNDVDFLRKNIDLIDREYSFWMSQKYVNITRNGDTHVLNRFYVKSDRPRPESYREDYENGQASANTQQFYSDITTSAESGWDFSSRWFIDPQDIKTIAITDIVPVDLNSILYRNELTLKRFHTILNNEDKVKFYEYAAQKRHEAMNKILWNPDTNSWGDFNLKSNKTHNDYLYATDLTPLWAGIKPPVEDKIILSKYKSLLMDHESGIPASNINTHQQWDFPNVWAPYHDWIVRYLISAQQDEQAFDIAKRFVQSVYCGWRKYTYIYEKYNADKVGEYGQGGEYVVQEGFGWTNGVAISFMDLFADKLDSNVDCNFCSSKFYFNFYLTFLCVFYFLFNYLKSN